MRIIDKNTDFYDYLQYIYPDPTFTFDRRDSYLLTKEKICQNLYYYQSYNKYKNNYLLLQVCNTFWLFLIKITKINNVYNKPLEYSIELLNTWKNYNKKRVLIKLDIINFSYLITEVEKINVLIEAVNNNNYFLKKSLNEHIVYKDYKGTFQKVLKHIPILKACGIADYIDPLDIFLSFEEYFSLEKTSSERIEAYGTTNNDKIENHGFDLKFSFRGKNNEEKISQA